MPQARQLAKAVCHHIKAGPRKRVDSGQCADRSSPSRSGQSFAKKLVAALSNFKASGIPLLAKSLGMLQALKCNGVEPE